MGGEGGREGRERECVYVYIYSCKYAALLPGLSAGLQTG